MSPLLKPLSLTATEGYSVFPARCREVGNSCLLELLEGEKTVVSTVNKDRFLEHVPCAGHHGRVSHTSTPCVPTAAPGGRPPPSPILQTKELRHTDYTLNTHRPERRGAGSLLASKPCLFPTAGSQQETPPSLVHRTGTRQAVRPTRCLA